MGLLSKLFPRQTITTTANEYHFSETMATNKAGWPSTSERPLRVEKLYAEKNFLGSKWTVYSVTDHPSRAVAHFPGFKIDNRWGKPEIVAGNLSLTEAFNRVRTHEETPAVRAFEHDYWDKVKQEFTVNPFLRLYGVEADGTAFLVQKKPEANDPAYWRNMPAAAPQL